MSPQDGAVANNDPLQNPNFQIMNRFLGYGNPDAEILFVGLEEGFSGWDNEELIQERLARRTQYHSGMPKDIWEEDDPSWLTNDAANLAMNRAQSEIALRLRNHFHPELQLYGNCIYYYQALDGWCSQYEFVSNLFPIPKPNEHGMPPNGAMFGLAGMGVQDYYQMVLSDNSPLNRLALLRQLLQGNHVRFVFFMIKGENERWWNVAQQSLFPNEQFNYVLRGHRIKTNATGRIWLTVHPNGANGLTQGEIEQITNEIAALHPVN